MSKSGYSRSGLFGTINHYDSHGHKIGESRPGMFGSYNNYRRAEKTAARLAVRE